MKKNQIAVLCLLGGVIVTASVYASSLGHARDLLGRGETAAALDEVEAVLKNNEADPQTLFLRARILATSGDSSKAIAAYERLIKQYPTLPEPYNNLAAIYAVQGKLERAREVLERGLSSHAGFSELHRNLNQVYLHLADQSYSKALRLNEDKSSDALELEQQTALTQVPLSGIALASTKPVVTKPLTKTPQPIVSASTAATTVPAVPVPVAPVVAPPVTPPLPVVNVPVAAPAKIAAPQTVVSQAKGEVGGSKNISGEVDIKGVLQSTLLGWAAAWSRRDIATYVGYYADNYQPDAATSHEAWVDQRRERIRRPAWIKVKLEEFDVQPGRDGQYVVQVIQNYAAKGYHDRNQKQFIFAHQADAWRIIDEQTVKVLAP